jgi:hypothetical protein
MREHVALEPRSSQVHWVGPGAHLVVAHHALPEQLPGRPVLDLRAAPPARERGGGGMYVVQRGQQAQQARGVGSCSSRSRRASTSTSTSTSTSARPAPGTAHTVTPASCVRHTLGTWLHAAARPYNYLEHAQLPRDWVLHPLLIPGRTQRGRRAQDTRFRRDLSQAAQGQPDAGAHTPRRETT